MSARVRVHVEKVWMSQSVRIWIVQGTTERDGHILRLRDDGLLAWESYAEQTLADPSLELPEDVAGALAAELLGVLPPDTAQAQHLADAIGVRDRLLAIVERP